MEEGRLILTGKRKARLVLNKSFPIRNELQIGDEGQAIISGTLTGEKVITREDDRLEYIRTFFVHSVKLMNNNKAKRSQYDNIG